MDGAYEELNEDSSIINTAEVGLPIGEEFKKAIAQKLDIQFEHGYRQISGDHQIMNAIMQLAKKRSENLRTFNIDPNPYIEKAWHMRDALPQAISIDNFLEAHSDNELSVACGKLGIVKSILEAERSSDLFCKDLKKINFSKVANTWFAEFVKILTENVSKANVNDIFQNISFINFNYDRCIEHYLFDAIQVYYGLDDTVTTSIMKSLNIIRPYGSVGKLPWQANNTLSRVPYGSVQGNLVEISDGIKTFNEELDNDENLKSLRSLVEEAEIIVFLGFAFHRQNLQLLKPNVSCNAKRIYATAFGISPSDCETIRDEIVTLLNQDTSKALIEINRNKKCQELFKEYWRGLTAGI